MRELKSDLDIIRNFESDSVIFYTIGMFLLSPVWLFIEYGLVDDKPFKMTALLWVCSVLIIVGSLCLLWGIHKHYKKRKVITEIYKRTKVLSYSILSTEDVRGEKSGQTNYSTSN